MIVGRDGPAAIISGRVAAILERHAHLDDFRLANRDRDEEVDTVLDAVHFAAVAYRARVRSIPEQNGTTPDKRPAIPENIEWMLAKDVAAVLGVTDRAIRKRITTGRYPARRDGRRWLIPAATIRNELEIG